MGDWGKGCFGLDSQMRKQQMDSKVGGGKTGYWGKRTVRRRSRNSVRDKEVRGEIHRPSSAWRSQCLTGCSKYSPD